MRAQIAFVVGALLSSGVFAAEGDVVTKEATGEAAVVARDEKKAMEEARKAALRNAIEQAAGVTVTADTTAVNGQLVKDYVASHSEGYVKSSTVVSSKVEKGVATVTVRAEIIVKELAKDVEAVKAVIRRAGAPSIVIVIQEQTLQLTGNEKSSGVSTTDVIAGILGNQFRADGWTVMDPHAVAGKLKLNAAVALGTPEAKEIGDLSKAKYILYGTATLRNQDPGPVGFQEDATGKKTQQHFPVSGEYDLTVFSSESGTQIAKMAAKLTPPNDMGKSAVMSYEQTTTNLINFNRDSIIRPMRSAIVEYLRNEQVNGADLTVTVSGLSSMGMVDDFQKAIETVKAVSSVRQGDFAAGTAKYTVKFQGDAKEFARAMEASTFKKKKITVSGALNNVVTLQLAK